MTCIQGMTLAAGPSWSDVQNPFAYLGGVAAKVAADAWTAAMVGLWNAGLWALRLVLNLMDALTTPDIGEGGPGALVYGTTLWIAGTAVVILGMVQLGIAAFRRDGRSLATVVVGVGQFAVVWSAWLAYAAAVLAACGGLTRALMGSLLNVTSWSAWQPWAPVSAVDIVDGTVATVLGLMGLLLWLAAIGHLLVMLTRAGALIVLAAVTPISAAGLVGDGGRTWFWKTLRWFHAAAFTPVLMVLMLGVGVQLTTGVATGMSDNVQASIATAVPGVALILIATFSPVALFKLLAFMDPSTSSGAALRQALVANGGIQGLLSRDGGDGGSNAASATDDLGRSAGELGAGDATSARFTAAQQGALSRLGGIGAAAAAGLGAMAKVAATATSVGADLTNQMGVGHPVYHPDFSGMGGRGGDDNSELSSGLSPDQMGIPAGGPPSGGSAAPRGATDGGGSGSGGAMRQSAGAGAGGVDAATAVEAAAVI